MVNYNIRNTLGEGAEMSEDALIRARKRAEHAVEGMKEGPLKTAAFQTILSRLLSEPDIPERRAGEVSRAAPRSRRQPDTLMERIRSIAAEGFFKSQRSLGEVREALGSHGWHYPLTTLSGTMQSLVRHRELRRERGATGGRKVWKYSNP